MSRLWRSFKTAAAILVLVLAVLYTTPLVPRVANWLTGDWQEAKGDVLIVLGGSVLEDGTLGLESYWRCVYANWAYRPGGFQKIVISGGTTAGSGGVPVAKSMADFISALGVPRDRITVEDRSKSTRENALMTIPLVKEMPGTRVLLTSDIHMRRAHAAFAKAGLDTIPAPIPDFRKRWQNWIGRWSCIWDTAAALVKYGYYKARGWV